MGLSPLPIMPSAGAASRPLAISSWQARFCLQPLDRPFPMIAMRDVGQPAAQLLPETWDGHRIVELEAGERVTPIHIAKAFATALGCDVQARAIPPASWEDMFRGQGMHNPLPRMQMLDGFNAAGSSLAMSMQPDAEAGSGLKRQLPRFAVGSVSRMPLRKADPGFNCPAARCSWAMVRDRILASIMRAWIDYCTALNIS